MACVRGRSLAWLNLLGVLCALSTGCCLFKPSLDQSLLTFKPTDTSPTRLADLYVVRFPDVLDVQVVDQPSLCGERPIRVDGRIELTPADRIRVEGKPVAAIGQLVAEHLGCRADRIHVSVTAYNSQRLFLQGEVKGDARAVPYVGPETVLEMLQRVGGITAGAAPANIQVVRAHVADGKQPEMFDIDLEAILEKNDQETNVKLQPFDQVYVGQSSSSRIKKCLPPWLRPLYGRVFGLSRPDDAPEIFTGERRRPGLAQRREDRYTSRGSY
jgi:protein involved in polysaccharide export with SLBB domain